MELKNRKFHLYYINEEYINYLRKFDGRVYFNKGETRPYVGTVCIYKNSKYFVPMTSPKEKHIKMSPNLVDIYKIDDGKLGVLNINNMIPASLDTIEKIDIENEEEKYKKLLYEQLLHLNDNKEEILMKISKFFVLYEKNRLYENIKERTCNFYLLEEKCQQWAISHASIIKETDVEYNVNINDCRVLPY